MIDSGLTQFETAAAEVLSGLKSKIAGETGEMEDPVTEDVQILLTSNEDPISMRALGVSIKPIPGRSITSLNFLLSGFVKAFVVISFDYLSASLMVFGYAYLYCRLNTFQNSLKFLGLP